MISQELKDVSMTLYRFARDLFHGKITDEADARKTLASLLKEANHFLEGSPKKGSASEDSEVEEAQAEEEANFQKVKKGVEQGKVKK